MNKNIIRVLILLVLFSFSFISGIILTKNLLTNINGCSIEVNYFEIMFAILLIFYPLYILFSLKAFVDQLEFKEDE